MEQRKSLMRNQEGFTLIEIIAVLVLLGILAAVAVPKYFDMQESARKRAADSAVAEGVAQVNMAYGSAFMKLGAAPTRDETWDEMAAKYATDWTAATGDNGYEMGDFYIKFAKSTDGILISARHKDEKDFPGTSDKFGKSDVTQYWKK